MSLSVNASVRFCDISSAPGLIDVDHKLAKVLDGVARKHAEVWHSTRTLAAKIGRSVRTVQLSLARLIRAGFVARVRDYHLNTRRRLALLWRAPAPPPAAPLGATGCAEPPPEIALTSQSPLDPPIGSTLSPVRIEGGPETPAADGDPSDPEPRAFEGDRRTTTFLRDTEPMRPRPTEPTPGAAAILRLARRVFPREADLEIKVEFTTGKYPEPWMFWALEWADHYQARRWEWVESVLEDWRKKGPKGPPRKRAPHAAPAPPQNSNPPAREPMARLAPDVEVAELLAQLESSHPAIRDRAARRLAQLREGAER